MAEAALDNVSPIRPDLQVVERRVVDTDNGFTRIANELLEALIGAGLSQNQMLITLAIIRKTYGYNKTSDWLGNAQLAELTGLPVTRCSTERNRLIRMKILVADGRMIGINKEISAWHINIHRISKPAITESVNITETVNFTESVNKTFTESVNPTLQNLLNTKDNSTKDSKDNKNNNPVVPSADSDKPPKETKRATQFPKDLSPNDGNRKLAEKLGLNLESEFEAFSDHHRSKGSTYKDWNLAMNTWLRNAIKYGAKSAYRPQQVPTRAVAENFNSKDYGQTQEPAWAIGVADEPS